jgi:hypothetical protein
VAFDRCVAPLQALGVAELLDGDRAWMPSSASSTPRATPPARSAWLDHPAGGVPVPGELERDLPHVLVVAQLPVPLGEQGRAHHHGQDGRDGQGRPQPVPAPPGLLPSPPSPAG